MGFCLDKGLPAQWPVIDDRVIERLAIGIVPLSLGACPPKARVKPAGAKSEEERVLYCNGLRGLRGGVHSYAKFASALRKQ